MHVLPFSGISEAQATAHELQESLYYFSIQFRGETPGQPIGLQRSYELMSRALGCRGWVDLLERLRGKHTVVYYTTELWKRNLPQHVELAERMSHLLGAAGDEAVLRRLRQALARCSFGCAPNVRQAMRELKPYEGLSARQVAELMKVDVWYDYHSRYNYRRSPYQVRHLLYERDKAYAQILGEKLPERPRSRRGEAR